MVIPNFFGLNPSCSQCGTCPLLCGSVKYRTWPGQYMVPHANITHAWQSKVTAHAARRTNCNLNAWRDPTQIGGVAQCDPERLTHNHGNQSETGHSPRGGGEPTPQHTVQCKGLCARGQHRKPSICVGQHHAFRRQLVLIAASAVT